MIACMKLQIVGGGKMGEALLAGVIRSEWAQPHEVCVVELNDDRLRALETSYPEVATSQTVLANVDGLIAVKPQYVAEAAGALGRVGVARVLSVAAGITTAAIEQAAPAVRTVRCMPNTPALVGAGASAIASGSTATEDDLSWAESILSAVGLVVRVEESELDAVTGLSGSGPAYVFRMAEALMSAGRSQGLDPAVADALTRQTLLGAARLLAESGEDPAVLRQNVTSPGGTTAAGLAVLENENFLELIQGVVDAAVKRSRELGSGD